MDARAERKLSNCYAALELVLDALEPMLTYEQEEAYYLAKERLWIVLKQRGKSYTGESPLKPGGGGSGGSGVGGGNYGSSQRDSFGSVSQHSQVDAQADHFAAGMLQEIQQEESAHRDALERTRSVNLFGSQNLSALTSQLFDWRKSRKEAEDKGKGGTPSKRRQPPPSPKPGSGSRPPSPTGTPQQQTVSRTLSRVAVADLRTLSRGGLAPITDDSPASACGTPGGLSGAAGAAAGTPGSPSPRGGSRRLPRSPLSPHGMSPRGLDGSPAGGRRTRKGLKEGRGRGGAGGKAAAETSGEGDGWTAAAAAAAAAELEELSPANGSRRLPSKGGQGGEA